MRIAVACSVSMMVAVTGCCFGPDAPWTPADSGLASPIPTATVAPVLPSPPVTSVLYGHLGAQTFAVLAAEPQPQAPDPGVLWDRAESHEGPIDRAMLVCGVMLHGGGWDDTVLAGGEDVSLVARFGRGEVRRSGEVRGRRMFTFPIAHLDPGATIWMRVDDVDVFFDDTIAEGTTTLTRAPFTMTMGQADVECRVVPSAIVASRAETAVRAFAVRIDALTGSQPDVTAPDLGYPRELASRAIEAARGAATWVQWSDPELAREVDRAVAFESDWEERASRAVGEAVAELPAPGAPIALSPGRWITASRHVCGGAANALREELGAPARYVGCLVSLTVETQRPLRLAGAGVNTVWPFEGWVIDARGEVTEPWIVGWRDANGWVALGEERVVEAGTTIEIVIESPREAAPVLLRLRDATSPPIVIRVD